MARARPPLSFKPARPQDGRHPQNGPKKNHRQRKRDTRDASSENHRGANPAPNHQQPFLALLKEAGASDAACGALPSPILGRGHNEGRQAADIKRTPTRPDKPKPRRQATLATEPTRKRARPRPTPFDLEVSLPSAATLSADASADAAQPSDGNEGFDTQEDLDGAIVDALDDSADHDSADHVQLPKSIAAGTDLFRQREMIEADDEETGDFKHGARAAVRAEKPLKRRFFEDSTKRLSPFDPSSAEFRAAVDEDASANDPLGLAAALDAPTASDDAALDRLVAKVREEKAFADGLPSPSSQSIDLDALPIRDDENPLLSALSDDSDDEFEAKSAPTPKEDVGEAARAHALPASLSQPRAPKPKLPFASMLAESLSLQPLERVPPEFSLDDVDGLGPLKARRNEVRDELADVAPHAPQILEPIDDETSRPLPVSVGTPTCHWRLDADGHPHLAAISLDAKSAPVPIEHFADKVESGSIRLEEFGLAEDDFAPIREATGTYRALYSGAAPRPDDVALPFHDGDVAAADAKREPGQALCAPAPLDFSDFDAPTFEGKIDAASDAPTVDDRFVDVADFSDSSVDVAPEADSALDDVVESPIIPDDLDLEDIDASILADVSLTDMSLVLDSSAETPALPQDDQSFTPSRRVTPIDPSVDVERVCAVPGEPVIGSLLDDAPAETNAPNPQSFASFEDDSLFDVSVSDFSPSKQSIAALSFAETSRGGLANETPFFKEKARSDASLVDVNHDEGLEVDMDTSYADGVLPNVSGFDEDDRGSETASGNSLATTQEAGEDSSISTVDLAMPEAPLQAVRPSLSARRTPKGAALSPSSDGLTAIPLRESVAHLRALQSAPRARQPLSRLTVEGQAVTEAARLESAVPSASAAAVRPPMLPPKVARPKVGGADGDRLRKGHDLYLLAVEKLEGGHTSEALLNAKLAAAYDPDNSGYRELTAFINDQARRARPYNRPHL